MRLARILAGVFLGLLPLLVFGIGYDAGQRRALCSSDYFNQEGDHGKIQKY
jgi:hypothetical protein